MGNGIACQSDVRWDGRPMVDAATVKAWQELNTLKYVLWQDCRGLVSNFWNQHRKFTVERCGRFEARQNRKDWAYNIIKGLVSFHLSWSGAQNAAQHLSN